MTSYRVLGTENGRTSFALYVSAEKTKMEECIKKDKRKQGYLELKNILVSQNLWDTAKKITLVQQIKPKPNLPQIAFNTQSAAQSKVPPPTVFKFEESARAVFESKSPPPVVYQPEKSIAGTTTSGSHSCCRALKKVICCGLVVLPAITTVAIACLMGDHYVNNGALRGRLVEQLGLDELTLQDVQDKFCLAFHGAY